MRRWIGWTMVAVLVAGGLVALARGGPRSERAAGGRQSETIADTAAQAASAPAPGGLAGDGAAKTPAVRENSQPNVNGSSVAQPKALVVRQATLTLDLRGKFLDRRFVTASNLAGFLGGYVESSSRQPDSATITMRVPAAGFGEAMASLSELGKVTDRSERGEDVTGQVVDLDARIRNQQAEEVALQDLMRRTESTNDALAVRAQLGAVREQIEVLSAQRDLLRDQAGFATIAVSFHAIGVAASPPPASERSMLGAAWQDAVGVALAVVAGTIVVLGALIPIGLIVGSGVLVWAVVRRRRPGVQTLGA